MAVGVGELTASKAQLKWKLNVLPGGVPGVGQAHAAVVTAVRAQLLRA